MILPNTVLEILITTWADLAVSSLTVEITFWNVKDAQVPQVYSVIV